MDRLAALTGVALLPAHGLSCTDEVFGNDSGFTDVYDKANCRITGIQ